MTLDPSASPAFGTANLSNCEREQIHLAGSIQPHGALLALREADYVIMQESANASSFLGMSGPLIGLHPRKLGGDLWARIEPASRNQLTRFPSPSAVLPARERSH